ncbi:MAG: phosphoenolpyruvate--protein phosphotransferase [Candidatus Omnitrophica bacterium]|nr:phosphoenolpyruvate--protein phosphotransferase [Candidatus Omnitrophota bacterium]
MGEYVLKGIPAAPGIALGAAFILDKQEFVVPPRAIMDKEAPIEIARFEEALIKTREEISEIKKKISVELGGQQAQLFDAHLLVLEDRSLIEEVVKRIKSEKLSAEYIFSEVLKKYVKIFSKIEDEYLRERVGDINDVGRRILKNLMDEDKLHELENLTEQLIIIAHDLAPSDTASMYNKNIIAFATDIGGPTSHTAIMAKTLGVPAVVGLKEATLHIRNQDFIVVDGRKGLVIIDPDEETVAKYRELQDRIVQFKDQFEDVKSLPAETTDGRTIELFANLELPEEVPSALRYEASGIGLYRTEYFYMNRVDLPSEEEQFTAYCQVAKEMKSRVVTVRTLDIGGDKFISSLQIPKDMFPFLGWRAIRFCLARPDIFKTQLRAILRATAFGNLQMMYPMITGVAELKKANAILDEVKRELHREKIKFDEDMKVGVMIEVPSAAMTSDLLAREADFFSIGTNDLIQYTLAVDRVNEQTASLYEPGHPGVLRLIKRTIDAAHDAGINVGLCGEMASDPVLALVLVGLNIDSLSMSPTNILQIKKMVRSISWKDAQVLAQEVLEYENGQEVEMHCRRRLKKLVPLLITDERGEG